MTHILNIESSTDICSISIAIDGETKYIKESKEPRSHTRLMTILIKECMDEAGLSFSELDAVAVSAGPGSYTSLRIGATTAKGIAFSQDIPMISICTLRALAYSVTPDSGDAVIAMIDARRDEVYMGLYDSQFKELIEPVPHILTEDSFEEFYDRYSNIYLVGNGVEKSTKWLTAKNYIPKTENLCSANNMAKLSFESFQNKDFADIAYFTPNYIKGANITKSKKPQF